MSKTVTLKISMKPGQGLGVEGPIDDLILCYGMMERAKDVIASVTRTRRAKGL